MSWIPWRRRAPPPPRTIWALDLETTGLDRRRDRVLSVGMVPIRDDAIRWGERLYELVAPPGPLPELSPAEIDALRTHQILPGELAGAAPLATALDAVADRCAEADALLVHGASVDLGFLREGFRLLGRRWRPPPVLDTLEMLHRLRRRARWLGDGEEGGPSLSLFESRRELGLPRYPPHHALYDALATAELYLVLRQVLAQG